MPWFRMYKNGGAESCEVQGCTGRADYFFTPISGLEGEWIPGHSPLRCCDHCPPKPVWKGRYCDVTGEDLEKAAKV